MSDSTAADERWMRLALEQAQLAAAAGEVPIGAVVVGRKVAPVSQPSRKQNESDDGRDAHPTVIGLGQNRTRRDGVVHAHAELVALGEAERRLGDFRLDGSVVYVTVEPCLMCLGALLQARIGRIVYGAPEPKFGALVSRFPLQSHPLVAKLSISGGVLASEAAQLLADFFRPLRERNA